MLDLPGTFWPESLAVAADGTVFAGDPLTGQIAQFTPTSFGAITFLAAGAHGISGVTGLLADSANNLLWACTEDLSGGFAKPSTLQTFDLSTGAPVTTYAFSASDYPMGAFCNDIAFDAAGNGYITDSLGTIAHLAKGGTSLTKWASNAAWVPPANYFGPDGIAFDGTSTIYMNMNSNGKFYAIPINSGGTAGTATEVTVTPAFTSSLPDGMRMLNPTTLILAADMGGIWEVALSGSTGTATELPIRVDQPSSLVLTDGGMWVSNGQIPTYLTGGTPNLPFELTWSSL